MINLNMRNPDGERQSVLDRREGDINLRVAVPGIVESFNAAEQTVSVKPAIREKLNLDGDEVWTALPVLVDVPIVVPRAGGYSLTLPIKPGDECIVVFADSCIDAWWQSGGVQNQIDCRRHDLSDGFAIMGCWSQPRVISGYSTNSAQLRNDAGSAYVEIAGSNINIVGANINIQGSGKVNITGSSVNIN